MAGSREAGRARRPSDPRADDLEAATWEHADRCGLTFEAALEDVRASIANRMVAAARIRAIRERGQAVLAALEAVPEAGGDGHGEEEGARDRLIDGTCTGTCS